MKNSSECLVTIPFILLSTCEMTLKDTYMFFLNTVDLIIIIIKYN